MSLKLSICLCRATTSYAHFNVNFYSSILFPSLLPDLCSISLYHHRPKSMRPLNECSTNNQIAKNITSNNFSSIGQQQSLCPTLFPQNQVEYYYLILESLFYINVCCIRLYLFHVSLTISKLFTMSRWGLE